jgi:hypothetical protein
MFVYDCSYYEHLPIDRTCRMTTRAVRSGRRGEGRTWPGGGAFGPSTDAVVMSSSVAPPPSRLHLIAAGAPLGALCRGR